MINGIIRTVYHLSLRARIITAYTGLVTLAVLYHLSTSNIVDLILGSLLLGAAPALIFHNFQPYSQTWGSLKSIAFKLIHALAVLIIVYLALWGRYLEYGYLVQEGVTWPERVSGILLAGFGFLVAGIVIGKGQFRPSESQAFANGKLR